MFYSVVLVSMSANGVVQEVEVVTGEEIQSVQIDMSSSSLDARLVEAEMSKLFYEHQQHQGREETRTSETAAELETRREKLVDWIKKNHLPVRLESSTKESGVGDVVVRINILDTVFIKPPYTLTTCESTNEIILDRVRLLITNFENKQSLDGAAD